MQQMPLFLRRIVTNVSCDIHVSVFFVGKMAACSQYMFAELLLLCTVGLPSAKETISLMAKEIEGGKNSSLSVKGVCFYNDSK